MYVVKWDKTSIKISKSDSIQKRKIRFKIKIDRIQKGLKGYFIAGIKSVKCSLKNLKIAINKFNSLLNKNGELLLTTCDFIYFNDILKWKMYFLG